MIKLMLPPSLNHMFKNVVSNPSTEKNGGRTVRGRVKSPGYQQWLRVTAKEIMQFGAYARKIKRAGGPYAVTMRLGVDRNSDIDNRIKAALDLFVSQGILTDDKFVDALHIYRDRTVTDATIRIAPQYQAAPAIMETTHEMHIGRMRADVLAWGAFLTPNQVSAALVALGIDSEGEG